jgi:diguanylate cyclase (GGDEF)-like protein/PAS domain S-box-containing protein
MHPHFQTLMTASTSLIIILDEALTITTLNPAAEACFNVSGEKVRGSSLQAIMGQEDRNVLNAHLMVTQRSLQPHYFQLLVKNRLFTATLHPLLQDDLMVGAIMIANDYTEQKRMEDDLYLTNQILSTVQHPMAILDEQERFKRVNGAFSAVFSPHKTDLEGARFSDIITRDWYEKNLLPQFEQARSGQPVESQNWYRFSHLGERFLRSHIYPLFSGQQSFSGLVLHFIDLTEMKRMEEKLLQLSITDALTGLFNRNHFQTLSEAEMARSSRYGIPLAFIMYDIDHFKRINDNFGHDQGDVVLKAISKQVQTQIRDTDSLFRWGGEEFILLLPHTTGNEAVVLAERIRLGIEHTPFSIVGQVTCSFGVTAYNGRESGSHLFNRLDELLYESKKGGRNRVTAE